MNLERKHLAPYLDHDLKIMHDEAVWTVQWLLRYGLVADYDRDGTRMTFQYEEDIKPILHPWSDLIKEIEHNSEKFIPLFKLCKTQGFSMGKPENWEYSYVDEYQTHIAKMSNSDWLFRCLGKDGTFFVNGLADHCKKHQKSRRHTLMTQMLFEWKFDVLNLIPEGLAVDINTITK